MTCKSTVRAAAIALALSPAAAFTHTGIGETSGFMHGFAHPVSGLDHILAMVMVGVQSKSRQVLSIFGTRFCTSW